MVRADRDHFKVSSNNPFNRLIVWMQAKLLPASQTRQITEARERFIAAIGNRYGDEGRAAARDVLGANSRKPLRSRDIRQVFDTLDQKWLGQPPSAPLESATGHASVPGAPAASGGRVLAGSAGTGQAIAPDSRDDQSPPGITEAKLARMAEEVGPQLEPYVRAGVLPEFAGPLLEAGIGPKDAAVFLDRIVQRGDNPRKVFKSGISLKQLHGVYPIVA